MYSYFHAEIVRVCLYDHGTVSFLHQDSIKQCMTLNCIWSVKSYFFLKIFLIFFYKLANPQLSIFFFDLIGLGSSWTPFGVIGINFTALV